MNELIMADAAVKSFCTFRAAQRLYGIEVAYVREVSPNLPVTPIPQAPPAIRGLVNLRSRIYLALDIRPLLGLPPIDCSSESRLMILKPDVGQDLGIVVERGGDIVHIRAEQMEPGPGAAEAPTDSASSLIASVCKLETELMMVVDPMKLADVVLHSMR